MIKTLSHLHYFPMCNAVSAGTSSAVAGSGSGSGLIVLSAVTGAGAKHCTNQAGAGGSYLLPRCTKQKQTRFQFIGH